MGLAARFTLWIGISATIVAVVGSYLLLDGAVKLTRRSAEDARMDMAKTTGLFWAEGAQLPEQLQAREIPGEAGVKVQFTGPTSVRTDKGEQPARVYRVIPPGEEKAPTRWNLFAPAAAEEPSESRLVVLVSMVTGGMLLTVLLVAALIGRGVARPVRQMIDDVAFISRGRYEHTIHVDKGAGEIALLGRSVNRMVRDLLEGEKTRAELAKRQRDVKVLRELRRNLQPMRVEAPEGWTLMSRVVEAHGAGTGDFVDTLSDEEGRITLVVGATATKGLSGVLLSATTRAYLRLAILRGASPAEACGTTNASLNRDLAAGLYASAMVARLNPTTAEVEMVSAGHKAPAVKWDAEAGRFLKLQPNGIALGFDKGPIFAKSLENLTIQLNPGDALFMFSPEAFEVANAEGKELGEKGVYALAKLAIEEGLDTMQQRLLTFLGGQPTSDLAFAMLKHHAA